jgi:cold shock CspA family protein
MSLLLFPASLLSPSDACLLCVSLQMAQAGVPSLPPSLAGAAVAQPSVTEHVSTSAPSSASAHASFATDDSAVSEPKEKRRKESPETSPKMPSAPAPNPTLITAEPAAMPLTATITVPLSPRTELAARTAAASISAAPASPNDMADASASAATGSLSPSTASDDKASDASAMASAAASRAQRPAPRTSFDSVGPMVAGVVKWYDFKKGYGFLVCSALTGGTDCFLHASQIVSKRRDLLPGDVVDYQLARDASGNYQAVNIRQRQVAPQPTPPRTSPILCFPYLVVWLTSSLAVCYRLEKAQG